MISNLNFRTSLVSIKKSETYIVPNKILAWLLNFLYIFLFLYTDGKTIHKFRSILKH